MSVLKEPLFEAADEHNEANVERKPLTLAEELELMQEQEEVALMRANRLHGRVRRVHYHDL